MICWVEHPEVSPSIYLGCFVTEFSTCCLILIKALIYRETLHQVHRSFICQRFIAIYPMYNDFLVFVNIKGGAGAGTNKLSTFASLILSPCEPTVPNFHSSEVVGTFYDGLTSCSSYIISFV